MKTKFCAIFIGLTFYCCFLEAQESFDKLTRNLWIEVQVDTSMIEMLSTLKQDEQNEQMRDWIMLAFLRSSDLDSAQFFEQVFDFPSIRNDYLSSIQNFHYGEGRQFNFKDGTLCVFIPVNSNRSNVLIGRAADEYRLERGKKPKRALIIEYKAQVTPGFCMMSFNYSDKIMQDSLFSQGYGYHERNVANRMDLVNFIGEIDDITFIQKNSSGSFLLGGRRFDNFRTKGINIEDISTLYQADHNIAEEYKKKLGKRKLFDKYENYIETISEDHYENLVLQCLKIDCNSIDVDFIADEDLSIKYIQSVGLGLFRNKNIIKERLQNAIPYEKFESAFLKEYTSNPENLHIGFSLDPDIKLKNFAEDLRMIAAGDSIYAKSWFNKNMKNDLLNQYILWYQQSNNDKDSTNSGADLYSEMNVKEFSLHTFIYGIDSIARESEVLNDEYYYKKAKVDGFSQDTL
jgi:hypothetical protein